MQGRRQYESSGETLKGHTGKSRTEGPRAGCGVLCDGAASPIPTSQWVWGSYAM